MKRSMLALFMVVTLAPVGALADGRGDLKEASRLLDEGEFGAARELLAKVAAPGNPPALRAEANQRLGCLALDMAEGGAAASQEKARRHFRAALEQDQSVGVLPVWGTLCREVFAEVKATHTPSKPAQPKVRRDTPRVAKTDPQALEREKAEREAQQAKFDALQRQLAEIQAKQQQQLDAMEKAEAERLRAEKEGKKAAPAPVVAAPRDDEQLKNLQASIAQLKADLDERDQRIANLIRASANPVPESALKDPDLELRRSTGRNPIPSLVVGGVAVLAAGTGVFFGSMAAGDKKDFDATPFERPAAVVAASGERNQLTANILFGTAAALGVTAAILYFVQDPGETE